MNVFSKKPIVSKFIPKKVSNFIKNSKGVAAVEFALIAPLLLVLFIGTVEISLAVSVDRKLSRTSSAIADLITQTAGTPDQATVDTFFGITDRIMFPYVDRTPCVVITSLSINAEDDTNGDGVIDGNDTVVARVAWSFDNKDGSPQYTQPADGQCAKDSTGLAPDENARQARIVDSVFPLPPAIAIHNSTIVVAEVEYDHTPIVGFITTEGVANVNVDRAAITLGDRIYLRPRQ